VETIIIPAKVEEAPAEPTNTPVAQPAADTVVTIPNEREIWDRLKSEGFNDIHVAAMMGNFRQESNYKTNDGASGLGIAQWLGNRRDRLINLGRYEELGTQLNYLIWELAQGGEQLARSNLVASTTLESATIAFQNYYERCNPAYCNQTQRITYAQEVYNKFK
jgi:hypothetical protein